MKSERSQDADVVETLQARLSYALDLSGQLRQAHWNVKGPRFIQLHELFEAINGRSPSISTCSASGS